jgi:hypothetical protein
MPMTFPSDAAAHLPGRGVTGMEAGGWLAPIPGLLRRDPDHCYWLGDHLFPVSITGVLAAGKSSYAMARIAATQAIWQPRGTTCHLPPGPGTQPQGTARHTSLPTPAGAVAGTPSAR